MRRWEELPEYMRIPEVRPYYDLLKKREAGLICKRAFDLMCGLIMLIVLAIPMLGIAIAVKLDSEGPVFYRQERVTKYGRHFRIHKFRTMVSNADQIGSAVTVGNDSRITRVGKCLRGLRLDELPQLFDVIGGSMSFVGTRPEAVKYVERYQPIYYATDDVDRVYIEKVLPEKMKWNLQSIEHFSVVRDLQTMFRTVLAVLGKDY